MGTRKWQERQSIIIREKLRQQKTTSGTNPEQKKRNRQRRTPEKNRTIKFEEGSRAKAKRTREHRKTAGTEGNVRHSTTWGGRTPQSNRKVPARSQKTDEGKPSQTRGGVQMDPEGNWQLHNCPQTSAAASTLHFLLQILSQTAVVAFYHLKRNLIFC